MKLVRWVLPAAAGLLWIAPRVADSCAVIYGQFLYTPYKAPLPGEFESGRLSVVRPTYTRRNLLLAYRTMSGIPLGKDETPEPPPEAKRPSDRAVPWVTARNQILGPPVSPIHFSDRKVPGQDYQFYTNCLEDAFESAGATLRKRAEAWGANSPKLAEWVAAQDQVFVNCSSGATVPPELSSPDRLAVADRNYQIAAAEFYSEQYSKAEAGFDRIAADRVSPWHEIAPYLAARVCIRAATIGGDSEGLKRAADRLRAILKDPSQKQLHATAQGLLEFVLDRADPQGRLRDLGTQLMKRDLGPDLGHIVNEYTWIWDHVPAEAAKVAPSSDVTNWVGGFGGGAEALDKWRRTGEAAWLAAALERADPNTALPAELMAAAHGLKSDSPAYSTVTYYGILQLIRRGDMDAARQWADQALAGNLPQSTVNLLRAERLRLARDWTEFLRFATRKPVALTPGNVNDALPASKPVAFDEDATDALNKVVPLRLWEAAIDSSDVPAELQAELARAAWTRAVIMGQVAGARAIAERVRRLDPALAGEMARYLSESDPAAAQFTAVFLLLRAPGLEPEIRPGWGRRSATMERDMFRDNWWSLVPRVPGSPPAFADNPDEWSDPAMRELYPKGPTIPPSFLNAEQRSAGEAERKTIVDRGANSVNFMCAATLAWATSHRADPRVPQALHLCVEATHYGPKDEQGSRYSHQAFDLLHGAYPKSEWTQATRFWY